MSTRFDRDTAVNPVSEDHFEARIDPGWWIVRGPNGGYLAAILVRAMEQRIGDPDRSLRSLNVHYLRPPKEGAATIRTRIERTGRGLSTITARLEQDGVVQAIAMAAFAKSRGGPAFAHAERPEFPPPGECPGRDSHPIPFHARFDTRTALGPRTFDGTGKTREAVTGGWIRIAEPRPVDAALLAAYADAWPPAVFATTELPPLTGGVPTVDLTVHVRTPLPLDLAHDEFVLVLFRTRHVQDGFLEEDGEIWSQDGRLLAHARQLGVAL